MPRSTLPHQAIVHSKSDGWTRRQFGLTALAGFVSGGLGLLVASSPAEADSYGAGVAVPATSNDAGDAMPRSWSLQRGQWRPSEADSVGPSDAQKRAWFRNLVRCGTRTVHVSGDGDDENPGTLAKPYRQISRAVASARPGDLIVVGSGTYGYTAISGFRGSPTKWLGIMTRGADTAAVITVPPPTDNFVNVIDSQFVGLYGFTVIGDQHDSNTNGSGISVYGNSHHVALWNNVVHDFPGGGINCFDVDGSHDMLDISYNTIYATSRRSPSNTSGISIYASRDLTGGETFPDGYGYRVVGNYVYDVVCDVPFTPGGYDFVTDGNGISLDCIETTYGYRKPILVAGNLVTGCGGRGLLAYNTVNVDVIGNTAVGNLRTDSPAINGGAEIQSRTDRTVRIIGNIILPMHTQTTADSLGLYERNVFLGGTDAVPGNNVDRRSVGLSYFSGQVTRTQVRAGTQPFRFGVRPGSPAPRYSYPS